MAGHMRRGALVALVAVLAAAVAAPRARASPPVLKPIPSKQAGTTEIKISVTVGNYNPDCSNSTRPVLMVNGLFQPTIIVHAGDKLQVTIENNIPETWPDVATNGGISIHFHGFEMRGNPWLDGTTYVAQCPIPRGSKFSYSFVVNEAPGTYWWHDHAAANRGDGLQGALIVRPRNEPDPAPGSEQILFLNDWWHYLGGAMAMRLNRPFDPAKVTADSGQWCWVGLPRSVLINGRGNFYDCEDVYARQVGKPLPSGAKAVAGDLMAPNPCVAGALGNGAAWPTCAPTPGTSSCPRPEVSVAPGSTTTFRIVNAATLVYMTVCFGGHNVTVVAADAVPVDPVTFNECVDINSGQRLDVQLTANQAAGAYWLTVTPQYRKGAPSAFGVLRYKGAKAGLPTAPVLQPEAAYDRRWDPVKTMSLHADDAADDPVPQTVDHRYVVEVNQPLYSNGYVRWALDNLANAETPPCTHLLAEVKKNPAVYTDAASQLGPTTDTSGYWGSPNKLSAPPGIVRVLEMSSSGARALVTAGTPKLGMHTLHLDKGKVVEIVIQNDRAGAFGSEYATNSTLTSPRNGREQHPFHLHGYHFWLVGMGLDAWNESKPASAEYNTANPAKRDTASLLFAPAGSPAGWVAIRFRTNNPGVWPLHCHINPHAMMGQAVNLIVGAASIPDPPKGLPECPANCNAQHARWTTPLTEKQYPDNPLLAPPQTNGDRRRLRRRS